MPDDAEHVELKIDQLNMVKTCYDSAGAIDQHNCQQQQDIEVEKYCQTHN